METTSITSSNSPPDWRPGALYPVLVEYAPNTADPLHSRVPGTDAGRGLPDDAKLGYGISAGRGFLWLSLPCIDAVHRRIATQWWGNPRRTVEYCREIVAATCRDFGGDPSRILLCGFSRGSIACNFIGLADDAIAPLWRAFVCHSHYDGVRRWPYPQSDRESARSRLERLRGRPQFISHEVSGEGSVEETRRYLTSTGTSGDFTFESLSYRSHTDTWVLRDTTLRSSLRRWVLRVLQ